MNKQEAYELLEAWGGYEEVKRITEENLMYVLNPNHQLNVALRVVEGD